MSGQYDASHLLGPGWFIMNDQAHYSFALRNASLSAEILEGGQILAFYLPKFDVDVLPEVATIEAFATSDSASLPIVGMPSFLLAAAWDANENDTVVSGTFRHFSLHLALNFISNRYTYVGKYTIEYSSGASVTITASGNETNDFRTPYVFTERGLVRVTFVAVNQRNDQVMNEF